MQTKRSDMIHCILDDGAVASMDSRPGLRAGESFYDWYARTCAVLVATLPVPPKRDKRACADPVAFARDVLGVELTPIQVTALRRYMTEAT